MSDKALLIKSLRKIHLELNNFFEQQLLVLVLDVPSIHESNMERTAESPLGTYDNVYESKRDWHNSYASVIGMMLYLESKTRPDIYFSIHQCERFTHNTKASHETAVKRIFRYIKGTKKSFMVFNPSKKLRILLFLHYILSIRHYLILLEHYFP